MWSIALLFVQGAALSQPPAPTPFQVLQAEHARGADMVTLRAGLRSTDTVVQRLAVRAIGRTEREPLITELVPLLKSPAATVRREVLLASAQMRVVGFGLQVVSGPGYDGNPVVRAEGYATTGRTAPAGADWEARIAAGLRDSASVVRLGAIRGLESFYRRHRRALIPADSVVRQLENTVSASRDADFVRLGVLARLAAMQAQPDTSKRPDRVRLAAWRTHPDAQVRRLAVMMLPHAAALRDTSALVRMEMLRPGITLTAEQLSRALADRDEHVRLMALDRGARAPGTFAMLRPYAAADRDWRTRAHAITAMTRLQADSARPFIRQLALDTLWQARAWAARAAMLVRDEATLSTLARDPEPNVRLEAIATLDDALRALDTDHAGLLLAAAEYLQKYRGDADATARMVAGAARAFERISRTQSVRWRDPRVALLALLAKHHETYPSVGGLWMAQWLRDADPEVQRIAIAAVPEWHPQPSAASGVVPYTPSPYVPPPFASEAELDSLRGATVEIRMRGKGVMEFDLLAEVAPMAVVTFARLATRGDYNGRTIHRVVPNFVLQGGSPGADEYDPATDFFMRDEVGAPNIRGSLGISTRGRDTGDGQMYFNLIDNVRLDFDYTVFANPLSGLSVMDRIQEGDVIESVTIRRVSRGGVR